MRVNFLEDRLYIVESELGYRLFRTRMYFGKFGEIEDVRTVKENERMRDLGLFFPILKSFFFEFFLHGMNLYS